MRIHFIASPTDNAQAALQKVQNAYGQAALDVADVIVSLGGDGFMLRTLHKYGKNGLPVYGMKQGSVGFLMNRYAETDLPERIAAAEQVTLNPLLMKAVTESGNDVSAHAINEVSLLRQSNQAAKIRILVNGHSKVEEMVCDGVLLATAAGSTAYNLSAYGPILPLGTGALALTPISPFRPRRWRGAILPSHVNVRFEVLDHYKRPVSATADTHEVRNVTAVDMHEDKSIAINMLFDPDHSLEERILNEQFL